MRIINYSILLLFLLFFSCVDNDYDLSNVDTDDLSVGDEWVAPLGTGSISLEDIIKVYVVPAIQIDADGSYVARYSGNLKTVLRSGSLTQIASAEINTSALRAMFDNDFVLSIADPHIKLTTNLSTGSVDGQLNISSYIKNVVSATSQSQFTISNSFPNVWIGSNSSVVPSGYYFSQTSTLSNVIKKVPDKLAMVLSANALQLASAKMNNNSYDVGYTLEIPLSPAPDFEAEVDERVDDAFDDSFVKYLFTNGKFKIYGTVKNELPFDLKISMEILDANNNSVGITFPDQSVSGSSGDVSFTFAESDMSKMATARHINFKLHLYGRSVPETLKKGETVSMNLKMKKTGGVYVGD